MQILALFALCAGIKREVHARPFGTIRLLLFVILILAGFRCTFACTFGSICRSSNIFGFVSVFGFLATFLLL
jgi:hypothetical protein